MPFRQIKKYGGINQDIRIKDGSININFNLIKLILIYN